MGRVVQNGEALTQVLACEEIMKKIIQCIAAEKISVAKEVQTETQAVFSFTHAVSFICVNIHQVIYVQL